MALLLTPGARQGQDGVGGCDLNRIVGFILTVTACLVLISCGGGGGGGSSFLVLLLNNIGSAVVTMGDGGQAIGWSEVSLPGFSGRIPVRWNAQSTPTHIGPVPGYEQSSVPRVSSPDLGTIAVTYIETNNQFRVAAHRDGAYTLMPGTYGDDVFPRWIDGDGETIYGTIGDSPPSFFRWTLDTNVVTLTATLTDILPVGFSLPHQFLFLQGNVATVWDNGSEVTLQGTSPHEGSARIRAVSPNGQWFAGDSKIDTPGVPGATSWIATVWGPNRQPVIVDTSLIEHVIIAVSNDGATVLTRGDSGGASGGVWRNGIGFTSDDDFNVQDFGSELLSPDGKWLAGIQTDGVTYMRGVLIGLP